MAGLGRSGFPPALLLLLLLMMMFGGGQAVTFGRKAHVGQFRNLVYVTSLRPGEDNLTCTGSLLSLRWAITARYCVEANERNPSEVLLSVGIIRFKEGNHSMMQNRSVVKIVRQPIYGSDGREIVVLVQAEKEFEQTWAVGALPIKDSPFPRRGEMCSVAGFGRTPEVNNKSTAHWMDVWLAPCRRLLKPGMDTWPRVCGLGPTMMSTCLGDAGAPVVCGEYISAVAMFNTHPQCDHKHQVAVMAMLGDMKDWLVRTIPGIKFVPSGAGQPRAIVLLVTALLLSGKGI